MPRHPQAAKTCRKCFEQHALKIPNLEFEAWSLERETWNLSPTTARIALAKHFSHAVPASTSHEEEESLTIELKDLYERGSQMGVGWVLVGPENKQGATHQVAFG